MRNLLIIAIAVALAAGSAFASADETSSPKWEAADQTSLNTGALDASQWYSAQAGRIVDLQDLSMDGQSDYATYGSTRHNEYEAFSALIPGPELEPTLPPPPGGAIPEPGTMALLGFGLAAAAAARRRDRARKS